MRQTHTYQENNKLTTIFPVQGEVLVHNFSSVQNGKVVQGVTEFIQHFGVATETFLNEDGEFIISGHVNIPGANFTPGEKVAANIFGTIGTIDKVPGSPFSRVGGVVFIIGIALTEEVFYMQFEHTKPLVQLLVEGRKYMLEVFQQLDYKPASPAFPAVCISRLHPSDTKTVTLLDTNWVEFVPALRTLSWKVGANVPDISYTAFTIGVITEITLNPANSASLNIPLLKSIENMLRYYNDLAADAIITSSHYLNLHLTVNFKGEDARIIDINLITETITIDYDSTALTTDAANIQIYPHRLASIFGNTAAPDNLAKAQIRKIKPETSVASGYSASSLLENRLQGFSIFALNGSRSGGNDFNPALGYQYNNVFIDPSSDGVNGALRIGETTRGNLMTAYIYVFGGRYVP